MTSYTLFSQGATGASLTSDANPYTFGVQFSVSQPSLTLTAIWFYSAATAASLPATIALYVVSGQTLVSSQAATWSGAAASGWVRAAWTSPPALTASASYKACVFDSAGVGPGWYSATANYWSSGPGSGGITSGPLSAPNNAGGDGGQDTFASPSLAYPASSFNAGNYWVDPEVTTAAPGPPAAQVVAFMSSM